MFVRGLTEERAQAALDLLKAADEALGRYRDFVEEAGGGYRSAFDDLGLLYDLSMVYEGASSHVPSDVPAIDGVMREVLTRGVESPMFASYDTQMDHVRYWLEDNGFPDPYDEDDDEDEEED